MISDQYIQNLVDRIHASGRKPDVIRRRALQLVDRLNVTERALCLAVNSGRIPELLDKAEAQLRKEGKIV